MIQPNTTQERAKHAVTATAIVIVVALHPLSTLAQTAKDVKGATPLVAIQNEAPARLIIDPRSPNGSPWVAYSFSTGRKTCALCRYSGKAALGVSPRVGHARILSPDEAPASTEATKLPDAGIGLKQSQKMSGRKEVVLLNRGNRPGIDGGMWAIPRERPLSSNSVPAGRQCVTLDPTELISRTAYRVPMPKEINH